MAETTDLNALTDEQMKSMTMEELAALINVQPNDVNEPSSAQTVEEVTQEQSNDPLVNDEPYIETKLGNGKIPYRELELARQEKAEALQKAKLLDEQRSAAEIRANELDVRLKAITGVNVEEALDGLMSDEQIEALEDEMPEVAAYIKSSKANLQLTAQKLRDRDLSFEQIKRQEAINAAKETIQSIPKLAHIYANNQRLFNEVVQIETEIANNPEFIALTPKERAEKAITQLETEFGFEIQLPNAEPPSKGDIKQPESKPIERLPATLSDLKGGAPVAESIAASIEGKSTAEIANMLSKMTIDKQLEYLARASSA